MDVQHVRTTSSFGYGLVTHTHLHKYDTVVQRVEVLWPAKDIPDRLNRVAGGQPHCPLGSVKRA